MTSAEVLHRKLLIIRAQAFADLFGGAPIAAFPTDHLHDREGGPILIDVLVYALKVEGVDGSVVAVVTNGMSDQRMGEGDDPEQPRRRELIQYLRECTPGHAKRLRDMAWLPLHDGFLLDSHHSIAWQWPAVEGTPWKNAFFLEPLIPSHRKFSVKIEGEPAFLLWHIPISDAELAFKKKHGSHAFIDRLEEVNLPWIFDESHRPPLL